MPKEDLTSFELRLMCQEILKNLPDVALLDAYEELSSISFRYAMSGLRVTKAERPTIILEP